MTFPRGNVKQVHALVMLKFAVHLRTAACVAVDQSFVNGKLLSRFLQFDGDLMSRLVDAEVFSVCPESRRNHLNADFAVRNACGFRFAIVVRLQFQPFLLLLAMVINEVNHYLSVFYWLAAGISDDGHIDGSSL
jgi:hypothetical protein